MKTGRLGFMGMILGTGVLLFAMLLIVRLGFSQDISVPGQHPKKEGGTGSKPQVLMPGPSGPLGGGMKSGGGRNVPGGEPGSDIPPHCAKFSHPIKIHKCINKFKGGKDTDLPKGFPDTGKDGKTDPGKGNIPTDPGTGDDCTLEADGRLIGHSMEGEVYCYDDLEGGLICFDEQDSAYSGDADTCELIALDFGYEDDFGEEECFFGENGELICSGFDEEGYAFEETQPYVSLEDIKARIPGLSSPSGLDDYQEPSIQGEESNYDKLRELMR